MVPEWHLNNAECNKVEDSRRPNFVLLFFIYLLSHFLVLAFKQKKHAKVLFQRPMAGSETT